VHWLKPDGETKRIPPAQLGAIGNGHTIKLGHPGETSPWDQSFEAEFDRADSAFPKVIEWLQEVAEKARLLPGPLTGQFEPHDCSDALLTTLSECVVSLAVRSPMNRAGAVSTALHFRNAIPAHEQNAITGMNMRATQRQAADALGARGKFVVIHSPESELIYGDGFFHNVLSPMNGHFMPRIVAPITPRIAVAIFRPTAYRTDPKLMKLAIRRAEAKTLNDAVQVYAYNHVFYRAEQPTIIDDYKSAAHRMYSGDNPMLRLLKAIPGTQNPNLFLGGFA